MSLINKHTFTTSSAISSLPNGSVDVRMIAAIRCILAFSGLVIIYVDPTQPAIFSALTYSSLVIYGIWSCVLAIMAFRRDLSAPPPRDTHWGDVLFCAYLVTLTQGTNSLFFTFFLFAILSASFSRGIQEGLLVTGASVILFILASLWFEPGAKFGFDQSLVRPIYLLTLGYMISYWGGHEITQRRRIKILQDVNNQLNQRLGYDHAIRVNLERILNYYDAKACILVLQRPASPPNYLSYFISHHQHNRTTNNHSNHSDSVNQDSTNPNSINDESAKILLSLPDTFSTCYEQSPAWWKRYCPGAYKPPSDVALSDKLNMLANLLDTKCYLTVPYNQNDGSTGRIYLIPQTHGFLQSDVEFVAQLLAAISHVVENIKLMDELVSSSAKHERFKISLDIHDTTIQPYIGLKLGLDALNRQAGLDNPLRNEISELLCMTEATISDLRRYVTTLREDQVLTGDSLVASINEQADHFKRFYGIDVKVKCDSEVRLNSRLAYAVLQIFSEGLSNILRHTQTKRAYISVYCKNQNLQLEIANELSDQMNLNPDFIPRSINARALSLGGACFVKSDANRYTVVHISIPL
jgi:signal transduction histidine kinase